MSEMGQKPTLQSDRRMSALLLEADITGFVSARHQLYEGLSHRKSLKPSEGPQPGPNGFPLSNRFCRIEPVPVIAVTLTAWCP
jgi:hypothetical protein